MITAYLVGDDQVIAKLNRIYPAVQDRLRTAITRLAMQLVRHVVADKLSGQVLGKYIHWTATNRLRNSINVASLMETGGTIAQRVGTNVEYGAFWEYGFQGVESVRGFMRRNKGSMKAAESFSGSLRGMGMTGLRKSEKLAYARSSGAGASFVRPHTRHVNIAPRSFLRSALADMSEEIKVGLTRAVAEGVKAA